jgi:maleate isomerase
MGATSFGPTSTPSRQTTPFTSSTSRATFPVEDVAMTDVAGFRATMGVIVPSTNTIVESDFWDMRIPGVTFHTGRIYIGHPALDSDEAMECLLRQVDASIEVALRDVMTCEPDYLVMGMSAPTFWGGVEGNRRFVERVHALTGLKISTGAEACRAALDTLHAKRISVLTPYQPVMRREIVTFFEECGFQVIRYKDLRSPSATAIARITPAELRPVLTELNGPDIDAIVQCGTNLSMVRLAAEAEASLRKPVIAINAATLWHAYRANGFADRLHGFGSLLQ